jgi:hypothetical protein
MQTVKKRYDIEITTANTTYSKQFDLDKNIKFIKGILMVSDKDDLMYYRGSQRIEISKEEIFPEGYESKLLLSGINVAPNQRYYDLGNHPVGNSTIGVQYKDTPDVRTAFVPYRVSIYLECLIT